MPRVVATDRAFFSFDNIRDVEGMGVRCVAVPKPGHRSPAWLARERSRPFRRARAWRAGGEARIARLKHTFGMHRTRYRGANGVARCAYWGGHREQPDGDRTSRGLNGAGVRPPEMHPSAQKTRLRCRVAGPRTGNSAPPCRLRLPSTSRAGFEDTQRELKRRSLWVGCWPPM